MKPTKAQKPKAPAPETGPAPSAFERMRDLTRRIVQVPKSELREKPERTQDSASGAPR